MCQTWTQRHFVVVNIVILKETSKPVVTKTPIVVAVCQTASPTVHSQLAKKMTNQNKINFSKLAIESAASPRVQ